MDHYSSDTLLATRATLTPKWTPVPIGYDISRRANHHVAFGFGVHQCLGQNLARMELEAALSTLFARIIPTLRLAVPAGDIEMRAGDIAGVKALPVTW